MFKAVEDRFHRELNGLGIIDRLLEKPEAVLVTIQPFLNSDTNAAARSAKINAESDSDHGLSLFVRG